MTQQIVCDARRNATKESHSKNVKPVKMVLITMSKLHKDGQWQPITTTHLSGLYAQFGFSDCVKTFFFIRRTLWIRNQEYDLAQKYVTSWACILHLHSQECLTFISLNWPSKQSVLGKKNPDEVFWGVVWLALWIQHNTPLVLFVKPRVDSVLGTLRLFSLFKLTFWVEK